MGWESEEAGLIASTVKKQIKNTGALLLSSLCSVQVSRSCGGVTNIQRGLPNLI